MAIETERKFLVNVELLSIHIHKANVPIRSKCFEQGYLSFKPSVRVRRTDMDAWITIKGEGTISRPEFEYSIPQADASELLGMCLAKLTKIRHYINHCGKLWEVDEFTGAHAGLWLAEVELKSADEAVEIPEWVGLEVTEDPRYTNGALAKAGRAP